MENVSKTYDGLQEKVRSMKTPKIDVWENKYSDKKYEIEIFVPEFTCICPKTGLPDFATFTIKYSPKKYCIELKSFKEYIFFYRNIGIFHEHATNKLLEDFVKACNPHWIEIVGEFNPRGGIKTTVKASWGKKQ